MSKIKILIVIGLVFFASCEKLLKVDYPSNQIGTDQAFNDVRTANSALAGLYAQLRDRSLIAGGSYVGIAPLIGSYSDELDCFYYDQNGVVDIYQNLQQESNTTIESIWNTAYQQIYYANSIIYGVEHSTILSESDKSHLRGEAILVRSLIYFYLQQIFGDIPYTTSLDYEYNRSLQKTGKESILSALEHDLIEAYSLLYDSYRDSERIYPNRKAAQLLLARVYLLESEWEKAEVMADSILLSPLYQFQVDINEVFHKSGKHILWQLKPERIGDPTTEAPFYYFDNSEPNSFVLTQSLVNAFSISDLRRQYWISEVIFNGNSYYRPNKYKNLTGTNTNEYSIVFRLEEVYFIKAESLARQNRFEDALPYLNATRERAGLIPLVSVSGEDFYNELLAEKRREFFCEFSQRFLDLKRFGRLNELLAVKPNWEDYKQVWPLPQSELLLNPNLLPQNVGY